MKKFISFYLLRLIPTLLLAVALRLCGAYILLTLPEQVQNLLAHIGTLLSILLAVCLAASLFAGRRFLKTHLKDLDVRERHDLFMAQAETIRADYLKARGRVLRRRAILEVCIVASIAVCLFCIFVGPYKTNYITCVIPIPFLFGFACRLSSHTLRPDLSDYSDPDQYPVIHALAQRAAETVGVEGKIRILFTLNNGVAGIARINRSLISLHLDAVMLSYMREEELYTVLLHEMAHIKNTDTEVINPSGLISLAGEIGDGTFPLSAALLDYPVQRFQYECAFYYMCASVVVEELADRTMAQFGDPDIAASALFKIECYNHFYSRLNYDINVPIYAPEQCYEQHLTRISQTFLSVMHEREAHWRHLVEVEIQSRSASHPILRARLASIGSTDLTLTDPEPSGAYREECRMALNEVEKALHKNIAENYAEGREQNYLKPLAVVEAWEERGRTTTTEEVREVLDALLDLLRFDEALTLAEKIIETEQGGLVSYAQFIRGRLRLEREDDRGIDDLYASMDNTNHIEAGLNLIGEYCCRMGLADRLEEYRERQLGYLQTKEDTSGLGLLNDSDELTEDTAMPKELFDRNLDYIKRVGGEDLLRVYLVRKHITEEMDSSIYILECRPGTPQTTLDEIYQKVFMWLDNDPDHWQYSLFSYEDEPNIARILKKVPTSCIYTAEE